MDRYFKYPIHWFVGSDRFYQQIQVRLKDPNSRDSDGKTLLHLAAESTEDNSKIFRYLLDKGAVVDSTTPHGQTPLHFAVSNQKRDAVVALLEAGASVNAKGMLGRSVLHFAISKEGPNLSNSALNIVPDMWILEKLLCHPEIALDPVDDTGETPLMWAVKGRYLRAVEKLLKKGANPNMCNINSRTPLHEAFSAHNRTAFALLTSGADIYCEDKLGQTPVDDLVRNFCDDRTHSFPLMCVRLIALRYQIRESLERQLEKIPVLFLTLKRCCKEVSLMKKVKIYDEVTFHDCALDCFQSRFEDTISEICIPVVELLLSGYYNEYLELVLCRIPKLDLFGLLKRIDKSSHSHDLVLPSALHLTIYISIRRLYDGNPELRWRLCRLERLLEIIRKNC